MSRCRAWNVLGGAYTDSASALQTACQGDCDMGETTDYVHPFDDAIRVLFADAVRITLRQPSMAGFFVRMRRAQRLAERRRAVSARQGVHVPPFMIISVTGRCNLSCAGCYAQAQGRQEEPEMTQSQLLDEQLVQRVRRQRNLVLVVSLEGHAADTDARRGQGVASRAQEAIARMRAAGVFFGTSLTVTRFNIDTVTDEHYLRSLIDLGCRLFFFVEYVPVREGTEALVLTGEQRSQLAAAVVRMHDSMPGLFIAFPGDEEALGGCLAAGRRFVHVSPAGRLEPCPFAPYSDVSVCDVSLRDALGSPLLAAIRAGHDRLSETSGGCALWAQREWVSSLLDDEEKSARAKSSTT
jgi:MoaA/NifB/PqqE/SkfB family radical SAM enzyme